MATTKLTLSIDPSLIRDAKRIASRRRTSVSAMFTGFLKSIAQAEVSASITRGPLTRQATGLVKLPRDRSDRQLIEDAIWAKHKPSH